jgi:hemin uptake protein HemP
MARDGDLDDGEKTPTDGLDPTEADAESGVPTRRPRTLDARALLGDGRVLHIEHGGEIYTLRLTRNDRLILTK